MLELFPEEEDYLDDLIYVKGITERVLFEVDDGQVWVHYVEAEDGSGRSGQVSCENDHGCLDYIIAECMIKHPRNGYYMIEGAEADYIKGDWGFTDDDVDFYFTLMRPARIYEIREAGESWRVIARRFIQQLRLHFLWRWGYEL